MNETFLPVNRNPLDKLHLIGESKRSQMRLELLDAGRRRDTLWLPSRWGPVLQ
jgi:hypothetical protein